jgi:hypothetical protein
LAFLVLSSGLYFVLSSFECAEQFGCEGTEERRKKLSLSYACRCTEKGFVEPCKKAVPEIAGAYFAAGGGNTSHTSRQCVEK